MVTRARYVVIYYIHIVTTKPILNRLNKLEKGDYEIVFIKQAHNSSNWD